MPLYKTMSNGIATISIYYYFPHTNTPHNENY